ncbi:MAG TPA: hypothetical protein VFD52_04715 [Clostridia bacterium]|nr:hypothetical protein [Clostridia bacterium]
MSKSNSVLVFVTPQLKCSKLIEAGKAIALESNAQLEILSIFPTKSCFEPNTQALEKLYDFAKTYDAQMTVYFSDDAVYTAAGHSAKLKPLIVVTGFPGENSSKFVHSFHSLLPKIPVSMVDAQGKIYRILPSSINAEKAAKVKVLHKTE